MAYRKFGVTIWDISEGEGGQEHSLHENYWRISTYATSFSFIHFINKLYCAWIIASEVESKEERGRERGRGSVPCFTYLENENVCLAENAWGNITSDEMTMIKIWFFSALSLLSDVTLAWYWTASNRYPLQTRTLNRYERWSIFTLAENTKNTTLMTRCYRCHRFGNSERISRFHLKN